MASTCSLYLDHPKLSFTDCYLAAHADHRQALPPYTFDKKFASQHPAARLVPPT